MKTDYLYEENSKLIEVFTFKTTIDYLKCIKISIVRSYSLSLYLCLCSLIPLQICQTSFYFYSLCLFIPFYCFSSNAHSFSSFFFSLYQYLPGTSLANVTCRQFDDLMSSDDRQAVSHNIELN
jgi:hypothetical protein